MTDSRDEDAMVSKAYHDKLVSGLNRKVERLEREVAELHTKLEVKVEEEKRKVLCPDCGKRLKFDGAAELWVCPRDGWHDAITEAIIEE